MTRDELLCCFEKPIKVLDHGFVKLVDLMGNDSAVVQAARVSYGAGTKTVNEDRGLIRYLIRHQHLSPIEMAEIKLHCKMPIFVARQWIRHRTANVNEISGRYSVLPDEVYAPDRSAIAFQSKDNKQGRAGLLTDDTAAEFLQMLELSQEQARQSYEHSLELGVARELARVNLPVSQYTEWYWKIDLRNLLHFLSLRLDAHAQYEIRVYAQAIAEIVKVWVPLVWEAFEDYSLGAVTFSKQEAALLGKLLELGQASISQLADVSSLSNRELPDFYNKLLALGVRPDAA